jgi:hypothetical protein
VPGTNDSLDSQANDVAMVIPDVSDLLKPASPRLRASPETSRRESPPA